MEKAKALEEVGEATLTATLRGLELHCKRKAAFCPPAPIPHDRYENACVELLHVHHLSLTGKTVTSQYDHDSAPAESQESLPSCRLENRLFLRLYPE
jgi:hypothetical protein